MAIRPCNRDGPIVRIIDLNARNRACILTIGTEGRSQHVGQ
jgi:hypothetical protein